MSSGVPKQFLELCGKPILLHTIERILTLDQVMQIVVALPLKHIATTRSIFQGCSFRAPIKLVRGGANRQESVHRAVAKVLPGIDVILVHDAVRPLCDRETMRRVLDAAWAHGGAVPGLPATETIQRISRQRRILATPPRQQLYAIQTPQCFRAGILKTALERASREGFIGTDESSIVRWSGHSVWVVPGSPSNIKITRPLDLKIAEFLMSEEADKDLSIEQATRRKPVYRIGQGIDYHRLVESRKLVLGGVEIPFEKGLEGYSDADALSHAIGDALLGAAALGDLGHHFPSNDPIHRNRPSLEFLQEIRIKLDRAGWLIRNVDATLLAQRPRLSPFMEEMQRNIAGSLGVQAESVSIKATTTEGLNAEGRGEGISAQAVALLEQKS
jgi:2-C-methyl-D-erythritol 4-phosphate cytidylyltransferase/2-C-methyl-D-erythritol 2,4-cyclodiphosphate synthase